MKRYYKKEPYIALTLALPYTVMLNIIFFGSCLFSQRLIFLLLMLGTATYLLIGYLLFGGIAFLIRKWLPSDADLFKRIAWLLPLFYVLNVFTTKLLFMIYERLPGTACALHTERLGWTILIGCLMSTIITIVNEGVANWEKWKASLAETEMYRTLSLIASKTNNAVVLLDLDERITWINQAFTNILGYTAEEALGQSYFDLIQYRQSDGDQEFSINSLLDAASVESELECITKQGEQRWLQSTMHTMSEGKNSPKRFFIISVDITERKRLEKEIIQQQKSTTATVLAVQEKERAIVGQELHDNINQVLTTVKLYNEICINDELRNISLLKKSVQLLQTSIDEIRSLSKRLSAPSLGKIKLYESVKELMQSVADTGRIAIVPDLDSIEELEVSYELHITIYRIIQEQLTNILKHAEASVVSIMLDFIDDTLFLSIEDNGKGFTLQEKSKGIGITNMITRAESIHGTIKIDTGPGKGCCLHAKFPML
jgi:PAS domain S-box-containing protein